MLDLGAFGAMLRAARQRRGLRPIDLALAMNWSGTAPVYRYERGGPNAPRPDPDTVNLFAQVLELDYADRIVLLGLAGHVPDIPPPTPRETARLLDLARPVLAAVPHPAALFDDRWRVLAINDAYRRLFGLPLATEAEWRAREVTLLDLVWRPSLLGLPGAADRTVEAVPGPAAEVQLRRFQLAQRLRRHEAWYRAYPACRADLPRFAPAWDRVAAELAAPLAEVDLGLAVRREAAVIRSEGRPPLRFEASHREVHGACGMASLLVMTPLDRPTADILAALAAADPGPAVRRDAGS